MCLLIDYEAQALVSLELVSFCHPLISPHLISKYLYTMISFLAKKVKVFIEKNNYFMIIIISDKNTKDNPTYFAVFS